MDKEIISDYKGGMGLRKLAKKYHKHHKSIRDLLIRNNIELRLVISKTDRHANKIKQLYQDGTDANRIGISLGISGNSIRRFLQNKGFKRRSREEYCKRYTINIDQFKQISGEICSYWTGFLASKGNFVLQGSSRRISCTLPLKDVSHLWLLARDLSTTRPVKIKNNSCSLTIINKELYNLLISYGVKKLKNGFFHIHEGMDRRHWMRGLIDGAGTMTNCKNGRYLRVRLRAFIRQMQGQIISELQDQLGCNLKQTKSCYWTGSQAVKIVRHLYNSATRYLKTNADKSTPHFTSSRKEKLVIEQSQIKILL